jgi:nucleoid-associated protein YgaU
MARRNNSAGEAGMQKDLKIGMFVGLVLVAGALVYFSTLPGLSPRARMLKQNNSIHHTNSTTQSFADSLAPDDLEASQSEPVNEPVYIQPQPVNEPTPSVASEDIEPAEKVYLERKYETQKFYIVRKGDTLSRISRIYYGSPNKWYKIYEANRDQLNDPDMLKPGMKLRIPN